MEISISLDPAVNKDFENYLNEMNAVLLSINEGQLSFHLDVMDGKLVERTAVTNDEYDFIARVALLPVDVHLMISKPHERIGEFLQVPPSQRYGKVIRSISFHIEALSKFQAVRLISKIQKAGFRAGVAVDLFTDVGTEDYRAIIEKCDVVVVMSVKAGKSGQVFNAGGLRKIAFIKRINPACRVILDGGINLDNVESIKNARVNTAVVGSYIYGAEDRRDAVMNLIRLAD